MTDHIIDRIADLGTTAPESTVRVALVSAGIVDGYVARPSPIGPLYVAFGTAGVTSVDIAESDEEFESQYAADRGREIVPLTRAPEDIERHLDRAIATGRPGSLPVDLGGLTDFQQAVLAKAAEIPAGEVRPYGWIAGEVGKPAAVRAVGSALARNPVPIVIPCHRVVRSDGHIGNYSLGDAANKRALLETEGLDLKRYETLAKRGIRFVGSSTTKVFCNPSCNPATRISEKNRVEFRSEAEARAAGYRPCQVCRPASAAA